MNFELDKLINMRLRPSSSLTLIRRRDEPGADFTRLGSSD